MVSYSTMVIIPPDKILRQKIFHAHNCKELLARLSCAALRLSPLLEHVRSGNPRPGSSPKKRPGNGWPHGILTFSRSGISLTGSPLSCPVARGRADPATRSCHPQHQHGTRYQAHGPREGHSQATRLHREFQEYECTRHRQDPDHHGRVGHSPRRDGYRGPGERNHPCPHAGKSNPARHRNGSPCTVSTICSVISAPGAKTPVE